MNDAPQSSSNTWIKVLAIGCSILLLLGIAGGVGCWMLWKRGQKEIVSQMHRDFLTAVDQRNDADELEGKFDRIVAMSEAGELEFFAFGALVQRFNETCADKKLDDDEVARITEILDDIINGTFTVRKYEGG